MTDIALSTAQPRAIGTARLNVRASDQGASRIEALRQSGSLKLVFPRPRTTSVETILVNTAGGITGGDRFELEGIVRENATLTVTTQAAERAYRAQPGETGQVTTRLSVAPGAALNWLPQELILFERCALTRCLTVALEGDARLLMVEPVVFGRAAMREALRKIHFSDRIRITRDGAPLYLDGMQFTGDATRHLSRKAVAAGAGAMANVLFVNPDAQRQLDVIRAMLPETAGASLIANDTLSVRLLSTDSFTLRRSLIPILEHLLGSPLPTSWRL